MIVTYDHRNDFIVQATGVDEIALVLLSKFA